MTAENKMAKHRSNKSNCAYCDITPHDSIQTRDIQNDACTNAERGTDVMRHSDTTSNDQDERHESTSSIIAKFRRSSLGGDVESMMKAAAEIGKETFDRRRKSYTLDENSNHTHSSILIGDDHTSNDNKLQGLEDGLSIENLMKAAAELGEQALYSHSEQSRDRKSKEFGEHNNTSTC